MQSAERIRVQLMMTPPQVAMLEALRRAGDGRVPSRSTVIRDAIEEKARRLGVAPATQSRGDCRHPRSQNKGK